MYLIIKRIFDVLFGFLGIVVLIPVSAIVKLVYLSMGDRGRILYTQARIGKDGKPFQIYKFRSMVSDAEEILGELLKDDDYRQEWEASHKFENDPRITRFGKFLRESSIDELPQLLNVLLGHMSLVGPRPLVEGELEFQHGDTSLYWRVKPGITGWWACHGRSDVEDYAERLELEYYYVRHLSLALDLKCIFMTLWVVVSRKGAK